MKIRENRLEPRTARKEMMHRTAAVAALFALMQYRCRGLKGLESPQIEL